MAPGTARLVARCAPLAVIALAMALAWATAADRHGVALVGTLPAFGLTLSWPPLDAALWWRLLPSAVPLALVAFVSSLAVAEGLALRRREQVIARRELAGLAGANLAASVCGGMPVGGSFSRSAINAEAGARTRAAGAWTALMMALTMLLLSTPLAWLPKAVLAASIVIAVLGVVEWRAFADAWRYARGEWAVMAAVAVLTMMAGSQWALGVGVALSIGLLLQRSANPHVARIGRVGDTEHYRNVDRHEVQCTPGVLGLRIDESLLFTNARRLAGVVDQHLHNQPDTTPRRAPDVTGERASTSAGWRRCTRCTTCWPRAASASTCRRSRARCSTGCAPAAGSEWFSGRLFLSHHQGMQDQAGQAA